MQGNSKNSARRHALPPRAGRPNAPTLRWPVAGRGNSKNLPGGPERQRRGPCEGRRSQQHPGVRGPLLRAQPGTGTPAAPPRGGVGARAQTLTPLMYPGTTPASSFQNAHSALKINPRRLQALHAGCRLLYAGKLPASLGPYSPCVESYGRGDRPLKPATEGQCRRARELPPVYPGTTPASSFQNARCALKITPQGHDAPRCKARHPLCKRVAALHGGPGPDSVPANTYPVQPLRPAGPPRSARPCRASRCPQASRPNAPIIHPWGGGAG